MLYLTHRPRLFCNNVVLFRVYSPRNQCNPHIDFSVYSRDMMKGGIEMK
jgi:hypothetical protein